MAATGVAVLAIGVLLALVSKDDEPLLPGGSRFAGAADPQRPRKPSVLDALAPLLADAPARGPRTPRTLVDLARRIPMSRAVAQLFLVGFDGTEPRAPFFEELLLRDWGGVVLDAANYENVQQLTVLAGEVGVVARNAGHVPPIVAATQDGGPDTAFDDLPPRSAPELAAEHPPDQARADALLAGTQLRLLGVSMVLAPIADVDAGGGPRADESFGDDAKRVARFVKAAVGGYRRAHVIAAVGHFPGDGGASQLPEEGPATVGQSLPDLVERDLVPFAAVASRAQVVLLSNALFEAFDPVTPASQVPAVTTLLRKRLRFDGVVLADELGAAAIATGEDVGAAAVKALRAGSDLLYVRGARERAAAYSAVLAAVRHGRLRAGRLRASLLRVLALKREAGLIDARGASR